MMRWFTRGSGPHNSNAVSRRGAWRCVGGSLFGLVALIALNLAGCGGGGGGNSGVGPRRVSLTILARDPNNGASLAGAVTLKGQGSTRTLTVAAGSEDSGATFSDVLPGTYTVSLDGGRATQIFVSTNAAQTIQFINGTVAPGITSSIPVRGRLLFNPSLTPQPIGSGSCGTDAPAVTRAVLLSVRNLDAAGQPIVFFQVKPDQSSTSDTPTAAEMAAQGRFEIRNLPLSVDRRGKAIATAFRIEITKVPTTGMLTADIFGTSAAFTLTPNGTVVTLPDVCTSPSASFVPTPPGATATGTGTGFATATPRPTATITPTPTATAVGTPTPTSAPTATATPG